MGRQKIGTFDTSILPYEDCCTVFLPKKPIIKPKMHTVLYEEEKFGENLEKLINEAVEGIEIIKI